MRILLLLFFLYSIQPAILFAEDTIIDFRLAHDQKKQDTIVLDGSKLGKLYVEQSSIIQLADIEKATVIVNKEKPSWLTESAVKSDDFKILYPQINIEIIFNQKGKEKFAHITANNIGKRIAVFINEELAMAPKIMDEINTGKALISTGLSEEEAAEIVGKINTKIKIDKPNNANPAEAKSRTAD